MWSASISGNSLKTFDHEWFWKTKLPERKGQRCRVLVRAKRMNSILVEFQDGFKVVTSRYAVRKRAGGKTLLEVFNFSDVPEEPCLLEI